MHTAWDIPQNKSKKEKVHYLFEIDFRRTDWSKSESYGQNGRKRLSDTCVCMRERERECVKTLFLCHKLTKIKSVP